MLLFAWCAGLYTPFWYIELFMLSRGSSASLAFYTIAIMNAAGVIGRIGSGYIADRVRIHSSVRSSFCFPSPPPPLRVSTHPFSPFSSCRALSLVTSLKFTQTSNADTRLLFFPLIILVCDLCVYALFTLIMQLGRFNTLVPVAIIQAAVVLAMWTTSKGIAEAIVFGVM